MPQNVTSSLASGHRRAIGAAAIMIGVATLFLNVSPVVTGAIVSAFGFSNAQVGQLIGMPMFAAGLINLSQIFWLRRVRNWQFALYFVMSGMVLGFVLAAFSASYTPLLFAFIFMGFAVGGVYGICMTLIGDSNDPDRGYGGAQLAQVVFSAPLMFAIPAFLFPRFGFSGLMFVLAVLPFLCLFLVRLVPEKGLFNSTNPGLVEESQTHRTAGPASLKVENSTLALVFGIVAAVLLFQGYTGIWVFAERIGSEIGLQAITIGSILTFASVAGGFSTLIPIVCGDRFGRVKPTAIGVLAFVSGAMLLQVTGSLAYAAACSLLSIAYAICAPYMLAQLSASDESGRYTASMPAIIVIASGIGPIISGWLYSDSYFPVLIYSGGSLVIALLAMMASYRLMTKRGAG
jgi:predicted MFS family arabinose efflux permease